VTVPKVSIVIMIGYERMLLQIRLHVAWSSSHSIRQW